MTISIIKTKVATTAYIDLAIPILLGTTQIDGETITLGDRILVKAQGSGGTAIQNGIYAPNESGLLVRTSDFNELTSPKPESGQIIIVTNGNVFADTGWSLATDTSDGFVTVGTDLIVFTRFSGNSNLITANVPSAILLRSEKGYPLTNNELDNNFKYLAITSTEKLNVADYTWNSIADRLNAVDASLTNLNAWRVRGYSPSIESQLNVETIVVRSTTGDVAANTFTGDLIGNADTATLANYATLANNVNGIISIEHGGTGAALANQARANLGVLGTSGSEQMTGLLKLVASSSSSASINIAPGSAPLAQNISDGDVWSTSSNLMYRLNGFTETIAQLRSPAFTGAPTAPNPDKISNSTILATTKFVQDHVLDLTTAVTLRSTIDSPAFIGVPTAPTPALNTNTTQIATTAFIQSLLSTNLENYYTRSSIDNNFLLSTGDSMTGFLSLHANPTAPLHAATKQYIDNELNTAVLNSGMPVGSVAYFAAQIPYGWLECNGNLVQVALYPVLFQAIGYTYGGSGTMFKLPDLRGEFIRGWDHGRGIDPGRGLGSSQLDSFKSHNHGMPGDDQLSFASGVSDWNGGSRGRFPYDSISNYGGGGQIWNTTSEGGTETRPRNVAMIPCIKAYGQIDNPAQIASSDVINSIAGKVSKTGDAMSGFLTLHSNPTSNLHAATKQYVDSKSVQTIYAQSGMLMATEPFVQGRVFTNLRGSVKSGKVYPPFGYTIYDLLAGHVGPAIIDYSGTVDANDSTVYGYQAMYAEGYIYIVGGNSEMRNNPYINYMFIWRK